jgi:hypothetical protein
MRTHDVPVGASMTVDWWQEEPVTPLERSVPEWRSIVMDAYAMLPALCITRAQGQRLWGMDPATCGCVLDGLVDTGALVRTTSGLYCRGDHVPPDDSVM